MPCRASASQDAPQHVAAPGVFGPHAVGQQEHAGAHVVGDDPHRHVVRLAVAIGPAGQLLHCADDRAQQIGVVIAVHALQDGGDALQAQAGVDVLLRQRRQVALCVAVVLHEHQVPQFKVAVALAAEHVLGAGAEGRPLVDVDFRARAARPSIAHSPEVVLLAHAHDALDRHPDLVAPDVERLVVVLVDGDPQLVLGQRQFFGEEFPGEGDGAGLEVIAERKVAEHFEEGLVAGGVADVFQVVVLAAGAHAFLRADGAVVVAFFTAQQHVLKLHHAGVGEQQGGVVLRDQWGALDDAVAARLEKAPERLANVLTGHC